MLDGTSRYSGSALRAEAAAGSAAGKTRRRSAGRWLALVPALWLSGAGSLFAQRSAYEELQTFSGVVNHIRTNYVDSVGYSHLIRAAIDGMLQSLDPHSHFVSRAEYAKMGALARGALGTTGISLEEVDGAATVLAVAPGSTAEKAGVMPGDRIVMLDDTTTAGVPVRNLELQLAGKSGSKVRLMLDRGPRLTPETFGVTLKREKGEWPSVSRVELADATTGYVRLVEFGPEAADELRDAIKKLEKRGAERLILDLRANPGGLVIAAVEVAGLFFPENTLVFRARGRKADANDDYVTREDGDFADLELMVLIDEGTASASEALAGAFQDHDRALLLGRRSFGKALIQGTFLLPYGDVVFLTIAHVVTPSGRVVQRPYRGLAVEQYLALAGKVGAGDDTLPTFKTSGGREVHGGGGIVPDVELAAAAPLPAWWSVAAERGLNLSVADSVAHTLGDDETSRARWIKSQEEWRPLLQPLLERVREDLAASPKMDGRVEERIAGLLAARVAEVRWGSEARAELELANDPDIEACLHYVPRLRELLGRSPSGER